MTQAPCLSHCFTNCEAEFCGCFGTRQTWAPGCEFVLSKLCLNSRGELCFSRCKFGKLFQELAPGIMLGAGSSLWQTFPTFSLGSATQSRQSCPVGIVLRSHLDAGSVSHLRTRETAYNSETYHWKPKKKKKRKPIHTYREAKLMRMMRMMRIIISPTCCSLCIYTMLWEKPGCLQPSDLS